MSITIETPTAEAIFEALKNVPTRELARLKDLLPSVDENTEWSDEDLQDFSNAGAALYEQIEEEEMRNAASR
ncbi:hypothetical protein IAD21_01657 [Abditibacteriota bacterium]|nr:hypothetical protein IAD21_01657 [Abditibacteriota bacterium]